MDAEWQTLTRDMLESADIACQIMVDQNCWPSLGTFYEHLKTIHPDMTPTTVRCLYLRLV